MTTTTSSATTLLVLLLLAGGLSSAAATPPLMLVTWASHPVRPNDTALLYGQGLQGFDNTTHRLCVCSYDPIRPGPCAPAAVFQPSPQSVKVRIPASLPPAAYTVRVCESNSNTSNGETEPQHNPAGPPATNMRGIVPSQAPPPAVLARLNFPEVWWVHGDLGVGVSKAVGGSAWLFGQSLAFAFEPPDLGNCIPANAPYNTSARAAVVYIALLKSPTHEFVLAASLASCNDFYLEWDNLPPGSYDVSIHNALFPGPGPDLSVLHLVNDNSAVDHEPERKERPELKRLQQTPPVPLSPSCPSAACVEAALAKAGAQANVSGTAEVLLSAGVAYGPFTSTLTVPAKVVLRGSDTSTTNKLVWRGCAGAAADVHLVLQDGATVSRLTVQTTCNFATALVSLGNNARLINVTTEANVTGLPFANALHVHNAANVTIDTCTVRHTGTNCTATSVPGFAAGLFAQDASALTVRRSLFEFTCHGFLLDSVNHVAILNNTFRRTSTNLLFGIQNGLTTYGNVKGLGFVAFVRNTYFGRVHDAPSVWQNHLEMTTFDGAGGAYFGPLRSVSADGKTWVLPRESKPLPPYVNNDWSKGLAFVASGPAAGNYARIASNNATHFALATPIPGVNPTTSHIQLGYYRGDVLIAGNTYINGSVLQLYGTAVNCVVAANTAVGLSQGFKAWGRNPHLFGVQPAMYVQFLNNTLVQSGGLQSLTSDENATWGFAGPMSRAHVHRYNVLTATSLRIAGTTTDAVVEGNVLDGGATLTVTNTTVGVLVNRNAG